MICSICPRKCAAVRTDTGGRGACGVPALPRLARAALHHWEEPCISGTSGSGTVFFSGCPLHCIYCQNYAISQDCNGRTVNVERLAEIFYELEAQGAHNINLVSPTHYVHAILAALKLYRPGIPVVYNTSGYESAAALAALEGWVDVYLTDMKYASDTLAHVYSNVQDYVPIARTAAQEMLRQTGKPVFDENGLLQRGTIVRHLVLPGQIKNTLGVLKWIREALPGALYSVMAQYVPCGKAQEYPPLDRRVSAAEYARVLKYLLRHNMTEGWVQERESAERMYIPNFDATGVESALTQK